MLGESVFAVPGNIPVVSPTTVIINTGYDKLTGIIYTQLSDIEEEDNGIFSYDRKIIKIDEQLIKNINEKLK